MLISAGNNENYGNNNPQQKRAIIAIISLNCWRNKCDFPASSIWSIHTWAELIWYDVFTRNLLMTGHREDSSLWCTLLEQCHPVRLKRNRMALHNFWDGNFTFLNNWNVSECHGTPLYLQQESCKTYLTEYVHYLNGYAIIRYNLKLCILVIETNIENEGKWG
jgi:hypothetical protein